MLDDVKKRKQDVNFIAQVCANLPEDKRKFVLGVAMGISTMPKKIENQVSKVTG